MNKQDAVDIANAFNKQNKIIMKLIENQQTLIDLVDEIVQYIIVQNNGDK